MREGEESKILEIQATAHVDWLLDTIRPIARLLMIEEFKHGFKHGMERERERRKHVDIIPAEKEKPREDPRD